MIFPDFLLLPHNCKLHIHGTKADLNPVCRILGNAPSKWTNVDKRPPRRVFAVYVDLLSTVRKHFVLDGLHACETPTLLSALNIDMIASLKGKMMLLKLLAGRNQPNLQISTCQFHQFASCN